MPAIELSEAVFEELRMLAEPVAATPEAVAARLIHEEAERQKVSALPVVIIERRAGKVERIMSPRLVHSADAVRLKKEVVELPPDAEV